MNESSSSGSFVAVVPVSPRDPVVRMVLEQYLQPLIERQLDVLLLGCTHYPLMLDLFRELAPWDVHWIDGAAAIARRDNSQPGGYKRSASSMTCRA